MAPTSRWRIALAGFLMQVAVGAVDAWSVFRNLLAKQFGRSMEVSIAVSPCRTK
jgi:MFS transporter, OFA family, oxalate/formate antiporter